MMRHWLEGGRRRPAPDAFLPDRTTIGSELCRRIYQATCAEPDGPDRMLPALRPPSGFETPCRTGGEDGGEGEWKVAFPLLLMRA